jgi:hypothetical protein
MKAPPALMRVARSVEILEKKIIRTGGISDQSFSRDLSLLLKASGCIVVPGARSSLPSVEIDRWSD